MSFNQVLQTLPQFIDEMQPDWGMVYDYVVEQMETPQLTDAEWDAVCATYYPHMEDKFRY
jgi:hypothetical protein